MLIKVKNDLPNDKTFGRPKVFKYKAFTLKRATLKRELGRLILNYPYSLSSNVVRVRELTKKLRTIK